MSPAADSGLVHRFVPGLRFDNELRYVATQARGAQVLAALPVPQPAVSSDDDGGRRCLLQAAVRVAGVRPRALAGPPPALADGHELARWCAQPALRIRAQVEEIALRDLGATIQTAMRDGGACGVQLETGGALRWALVSGTEACGIDGNVRALLLVDPGYCVPWCAGYNARIELRTRARKGLALRSTEGHHRDVQPRRLLVVKPSGFELALRTPDQL